VPTTSPQCRSKFVADESHYGKRFWASQETRVNASIFDAIEVLQGCLVHTEIVGQKRSQQFGADFLAHRIKVHFIIKEFRVSLNRSFHIEHWDAMGLCCFAIGVTQRFSSLAEFT